MALVLWVSLLANVTLVGALFELRKVTRRQIAEAEERTAKAELESRDSYELAAQHKVNYDGLVKRALVRDSRGRITRVVQPIHD